MKVGLNHRYLKENPRDFRNQVSCYFHTLNASSTWSQKKYLWKITNPRQFNFTVTIYKWTRMVHTLRLYGELVTGVGKTISARVNACLGRKLTCIQNVKIIIIYFIISICRFPAATKYKKPFTNKGCTMTFPCLRSITPYTWRNPCMWSCEFANALTSMKPWVFAN